MTAHTFTAGSTVTITAPEGDALWTTRWWPRTGAVTGTVQRTFKKGTVEVAVHALRNRSEDGCHSMTFPAEWLQVTA